MTQNQTRRLIDKIKTAQAKGTYAIVLHYPKKPTARNHVEDAEVREAALSLLGGDSDAFEVIEVCDRQENISGVAWIEQQLQRLRSLLDQDPNKVGIAHIKVSEPTVLRELFDCCEAEILAHDRLTLIYGLVHL